jgi:hypothetical protein
MRTHTGQSAGTLLTVWKVGLTLRGLVLKQPVMDWK